MFWVINNKILLSIFILSVSFSAAYSTDEPESIKFVPVRLINLQTGYLLGEGTNKRIGIGESGFAVREKVQFTTNTLLDLITFINGQIKLAILDDGGGIPAVSVGFGYYNLISSNFVVEEAIRSGFSDREMDIDSGLEVYSCFISASKELNSMIRVHTGYQYHYLKGHVDSDEPFELTSERDTVAIYMSLDQDANHHCIMSGLDVDPFERVKLLLELGYDASYDRGRGGTAVRINPFDGFNVQVGIVWPGMELGDDLDIPVLPQFSVFWRF